MPRITPSAVAFAIGILAGAILMYIATGFIGPPTFERMRWMATLMALIPGLLLGLTALYRYRTEDHYTFSMRDALRYGSVLMVLLPLVVWLGYPHVHAAIGRTTGGWTLRCTSLGCEWAQDRRPAPQETQRKRP